MPAPISPTPATIARAKRDAKRLARELSITHTQALELEAVRLGFSSWHDFVSAAAKLAGEVPLDPELPPDFDNTPNEDRPTSQLDVWWDRLYARTRRDGTFDVYCLNGGAWDRPTWLATASTFAEACTLASRKQARWLQFRRQPHGVLGERGEFSVVEPAQRPDQEARVLATGLDAASAQSWIENWRRQHNSSEDDGM